MTQRKSALLHIAVGFGLLCSTVFMPSPTTAEMETPQSQQGSGSMKDMKQMMGECRAHLDKSDKAIDQMMMKMEEGRRSNDAAKMRATLKASRNGLAQLKQDMTACKNMMSMMDKMESGMGGPMGDMGGMHEGMGGMREGMGMGGMMGGMGGMMERKGR
ncbi:MAG: hypothetical protein OJF50_006541 [Nitrospira sp.]|jgi:hypothetical protein|nr:hypothetical protein [Nitrospira sp.]